MPSIYVRKFLYIINYVCNNEKRNLLLLPKLYLGLTFRGQDENNQVGKNNFKDINFELILPLLNSSANELILDKYQD